MTAEDFFVDDSRDGKAAEQKEAKLKGHGERTTGVKSEWIQAVEARFDKPTFIISLLIALK
jgi:hypothetical protein